VGSIDDLLWWTGAAVWSFASFVWAILFVTAAVGYAFRRIHAVKEVKDNKTTKGGDA